VGAQGRPRLSGVGRGASVSLTADRRKQLSGMDAAQIDGHHLWREVLGASPINSRCAVCWLRMPGAEREWLSACRQDRRGGRL